MKYALLATVLLALCLSGCVGFAGAMPPSEKKSALDAALDENSDLRRSLEVTTALNQKLSYDLEITRIELQKARAALDAEGLAPAENVEAFRDFVVEETKFGILTGPSDWDDRPGLDGIAVNFLLKDSEGTTLKRKGNVIFDLIDVSGRSPEVIMSWAVPAEVLGSSWQSLPPGFRMKLPWQGDVPWGQDAVFKSLFTDAYGRQFTSSIIIHIDEKPAVDEASTDIME